MARAARTGVALAMACAGWLVAAPASARPATYVCGEDLEVKIDFTPRKAQLHLRDKDHTLLRVRSARDGHYMNRKAGIDLVARKGDLRLREGKTELRCKLKITP